MPNLLGLHDREAVAIAAADSWVLDTVALSENPQPTNYRSGLHWICRCNWGYGSTGTLPVVDQYQMFAQRVAAYVKGSSGCSRWQIGNEPNLPREWPDQIPIYPWHYAACFKLCRNAIHALPGHEYDEVLIAGSGPWNDELKYMSNPHGDWIQYFAECIDLCDGALDGFAIHAYTHGYDPALVTSTARMDAPFHNRYYNFYTYKDYMHAIPPALHHLPAYITEANGDGPWQATGLMPAMLAEIDKWNYSLLQPIQAVIFYRYPHYDHFYIEGRGDVIAEYQAAAARGYVSPGPDVPPFEPEPPWEPEPTPEPARDIDPALYARGVHFDFVKVPAGTGYWRIIAAEWLDEQEADAVGPDHHILGMISRDGALARDVPMRVTWPSGMTTIYSKAEQPNAAYNYDYPMTASLNEFAIQVDDGAPSDRASGIGMGAGGNPGIHTSTWIDYVWTIASDETTPPITPPLPVQIEAGRVTATDGLNLRAQPNTQAQIYGTLAYRSTVLYDREQDGWLHTVDGWVSGEYVGPEGAPVEDAPANSQQPTASSHLVHPLPGARITTHWGESAPEYSPGMWGHAGIDFAIGKGTPIACLADGVVTHNAFDAGGYGHFLMVRHDAIRKETLYAHLDEPGVPVGTVLRAGDTLGKVGSSGNSTGPHCHIELRDLNADGSYKQGSPMPRGRIDIETWCFTHGLTL